MVLKDIFSEVQGYARRSIPKNRMIFFFNESEKEVFSLEHNTFFNQKIGTKISSVKNQRNYPIPSDSREVFEFFVADSFAATANTETVGTLDSGDFTSTEDDDGVNYQVSPTASGLDVFLTFQAGGVLPVEVFINGRYEANANEFVDIFAFNFDTSAFVQLSTTSKRFDNATVDSSLTFTLASNQISSTGEIRIGFQTTDTDVTNNLFIDQCILNTDDLESTPLEFEQRGNEILLVKNDIPTLSNLALFPKYFFLPTEITSTSNITTVTQSLPEAWTGVLIARMKVEADLDRYGTSNYWSIYNKKVATMSGKTESRRSFQAQAFDTVGDVKVPRF